MRALWLVVAGCTGWLVLEVDGGGDPGGVWGDVGIQDWEPAGERVGVEGWNVDKGGEEALACLLDGRVQDGAGRLEDEEQDWVDKYGGIFTSFCSDLLLLSAKINCFSKFADLILELSLTNFIK